nr:hypothetical protein [Gemmatales bacterium]
ALSPATSPAASGSSVPVLLLEDRVARLEEAGAALAELQHWEDNPTSSSTAIPQEAEVVRATPIPPPPTASLAEFTIPSLNTTSPSPGLPNLLQPVKAALPFTAQLVNRVLPASSLWRDIWWDLHTFWRMLRDPFYPKTTTFKIVPLFAIFYVTIWPWFSSWGGLLGTLMSYVVNGVVLYIAFKVVQRELRRYYDFAEKYHKNR